MSNQSRNPGVGGTLTGGIQDVSAILPIIGTNQCERHMGSALFGGYIYAAATPLSTFGSLGIVKAGVAVLISSISIAKFWVSHHDLRPSGGMGKVKQSLFLGARMLEDAGFKHQGDVSPLIGMDGTRFKAETKLIQILEDKHIENPEKVSIRWKSKQWNIMLVLATIVAAVISGAPYFALLVGPASWRPSTDLPWLFPFLRTVGSCLASVCCQFIIQSRVISSMKNRIIFMDIQHRTVNGLSKDNKANLDDWLKYHLQWDPSLPAEECIWNLEQSLSYYDDFSNIGDDVEPTEDHISIEMTTETSLPSSPPRPLFKEEFKLSHYDSISLRRKHFPSATRDRVFAFITWIVLCISLPATVAGYVGCFTLVGATPSQGNGPLVWLGLEAALSIIRILIWAWNPKFDEDTDVTVVLDLVNEQPFPESEEVNDFIAGMKNDKIKPLVLLPEHRFLEGITAYCGPLDQFRSSENIALYFTLMADTDDDIKYLSLLITVFDFNTRISVTLLQFGGLFYYFDADVKYEAAFSKIYANVQSTMRNIRPWQTRVGILFHSLEAYYTSLVHALNRVHDNVGEWHNAELNWSWDLSPKPSKTLITSASLPSSPDQDLFYYDEKYEHNLKTELINLWRRWIHKNMGYRAHTARGHCYETFADLASEKAKWELTELDRLVAWEWTRRELAILMSSIELEEILRFKIEKRNPYIVDERQRGKRVFGFELGRLQRMDNERREAKERMKKAMKKANDHTPYEKRSWEDQGRFAPKWQECIEFIDNQWSEGISKGSRALKNAESELYILAQIDIVSEDEDRRGDLLCQVNQRFTHWHSQRENEQREMEATVERIRRAGDQRDQLDTAYKYPEPDKQAPFKFTHLGSSSSKGKACAATVYDVQDCSVDDICDVVKKSTTRSVINIDPKIVASIPPNDHLLFLSCQGEGGDEPAFVQHNRDRWWNQQTTNSALLYFTPRGVVRDSCYVESAGPIAQILVFLTNPSRVRLRLRQHWSWLNGDSHFLLSIHQKGEHHYKLSNGILDGFSSQDLESEELPRGRHELQVFVARNPEKKFMSRDHYYLRDILIEFFNDPFQNSSVAGDMDKRLNEIESTIGAAPAYDADEESSNRQESPLLLDQQDSGLENHPDIQILNEERDLA